MRITCLPANQFEHVNLAISRRLITLGMSFRCKFLVTGMVTRPLVFQDLLLWTLS